MNDKSILITGSAGFIGAAVVSRLLEKGFKGHIFGIDNVNDYYDVSLKEYRIGLTKELADKAGDVTYELVRGDISDRSTIFDLFEKAKPDIVINLAAQAGVRYSIENPDAYMSSNITGFYNILEACRHSYDEGAHPVEHLVFASSSSVYGGNTKVPFSEDDMVDHPVSLYAATKKSNELLGHSYSKLYGIPCTGLRFFTVYGPAGRPDMAYFSFTEKLRRGEKIKIFNYGNCKRDFTYIDDIVEGILRIVDKPPVKETGADGLPLAAYSIYNIGNSNPENLMDFVSILGEELIGAGVLPGDFKIEDAMEFVPMQPGDVPVTYADTQKLYEAVGYKPSTSLREGLASFAKWYHDFYL